jgi:hypothetical protein
MSHTLKSVLRLKGLPFVKALLELEEYRFQDGNYTKGSTFEEINKEFGIFPIAKAYPVHFAGDIQKPPGKIIFVGINPGYAKNGKQQDRQKAEQKFLERHGQFDGYCRIFSDFYATQEKGLLPYFANIAGFIKRYYNVEEKIDWHWLQRHLISLDLIPYHSTSSAGVSINNPSNFRSTYLEIFLRLIRYLNPKKPIFFNGFPTFAEIFSEDPFRDVFKFRKYGKYWMGKIDDEFEFFGLPFLTRVRGGKDALVRNVRRHRGVSRSKQT